ncbi:MAG: hypothetical protein CMK07_09705 [Ponticaulis sp.]|nr:hypothetical protein [Ponticaulis sp.]
MMNDFQRLRIKHILYAALALTVSMPAAAMSMDSQIRFDYVASVQGEGRWECGVMSSDGLYEVGGQARFQISDEYRVFAPTLSFVEMGDAVYYNRGAMRGWAYESDAGEAVIDLTISQVTQADDLPAGYQWSRPEAVRLILNVVEEADPSLRGPYSLQGTLWDDYGSSPYTCYEKTQPELLF